MIPPQNAAILSERVISLWIKVLETHWGLFCTKYKWEEKLKEIKRDKGRQEAF